VFGDCDCLFVFIFATIELNVDGFDEEDDFEELKEDQGQANQGKPPLLVAYLDPNFIYASLPLCLFQRCIVL
jgi:hypothetical protein